MVRTSTRLRGDRPLPAASVVAEGDYDLGIAFDSDGDRMLAVDAEGEAVDGDQILAVLAIHLEVSLVAVTVMTNLGFHLPDGGASDPSRHDTRRRSLRLTGAAPGKEASWAASSLVTSSICATT